MAVESFINVDNLTYCGKEAQTIFAKDVYDIDLRSYGVTFMDGIKGKKKLYDGEMGDVWQAYTCAFTPQGEVKLSEDFIEPAAIKVNMEECYDKFWNTFLVEQTAITLNGGIPQTFSEWYFGKLRQKMAIEYQEIFFQGDTARIQASKAYLKVTDGVEKRLEGATGATKMTGATITVDNVIGQVEAAISAGIAKAAEDDINTDGYKVLMNYNDVKTLEVALGKLCCGNSTQAIFSNYGRNGNGNIVIMGFEVVPSKVSASKIIFGPIANLVLGFDTFDSHIEYKLIDMRQVTLDNSFRVGALSNIAVGIVFPELFVISRP